MTSLSRADAIAFLRECEGKKLGALWHLLLMGGLRPGEALALKWPDLDHSRISVRRALTFHSASNWSLHDPKTERARRTVVIPETTVRVLHAHREEQDATRTKAGATWVDNDFIFANDTGGPLDWREVSRRHFLPLFKRIGRPDLRPYDLRHSCATLLLDGGENAKVVAERLGHASVSLTLDVYSHVLPSMQARSAERLESLCQEESHAAAT